MPDEHTCEAALSHHVRLVLDNEYDLYRRRREIVRVWAWGDAPVSAVADALKDWCEELTGLEHGDMGHVFGPPVLAREVLSTALAWVDWMALARDYIAEREEEADHAGS